jgi:tetratricopeptide (TPR) repeat protein
VYRLNLGKLLVLMKKFEEARELYGELLKKEPENPIFLCNYGVSLFCLDRKDEAIAKFEKILKKYPDFEDAKTNLEVAREKPDKDAKPKSMLPSAPDM